MVSRFTRRFDPEKPRDHLDEQFDTHQPPMGTPIPSVPPWSALVLPGGRPHSLYHGRRDCEALTADVRLAAQCAQDVKVQIVKLDAVRGREDRVGCPLCRPTETDYSKIKDCSVETEMGPQEGMRLLWREDPAAGWYSLVTYKVKYRQRSRLVAESRSAGELRELPSPS